MCGDYENIHASGSAKTCVCNGLHNFLGWNKLVAFNGVYCAVDGYMELIRKQKRLFTMMVQANRIQRGVLCQSVGTWDSIANKNNTLQQIWQQTDLLILKLTEKNVSPIPIIGRQK